MATTPDFLGIESLDRDFCEDLLQCAAVLKAERAHSRKPIQAVEGRTVAMVFEKPSLRTRMGFEVAIHELGGNAVHLDKSAVGIGSRESLKDVTLNLDRWCAAIVARLFWQDDLVAMADMAESPVLNALTEHEHPCQAFADLMTVREKFGDELVKIAYIGDGNNVARSLALLAARLGHPVTICGPDNFRLEEIDGVSQTADVEEGLADAKVVYTDVWVSMGDEREQEQRLKVFQEYQVNRESMAKASSDAVFMHCLPAWRGYEVTDEVIDSQASVVYDQAENRFHVQKALLERVFGLE